MTLTRRTPMKRKRDTARRRFVVPPALQCANKRCRKVATVLEWCMTHARAEADRLFSRYVRLRDGHCMVCGGSETSVDGLQCSQIIPKSRSDAVRWDPTNAVAAHMTCHHDTTHHPAGWDRWALEFLGEQLYGALHHKARRGGRPDVGWVILELRKRLEGMAA